MSEHGPKVTIIGAGSLFFGRQAIWQMVHSDHLNSGTLALVDIDADRLAKLEKLARMVVEETGVSLKIEASTDRRAVLPGSDFVVLSFARDTVRYRGLDTVISEKYGIRMCSGDTIGPGGVFRAMRELPHIMSCARDVRELCPDAWASKATSSTTERSSSTRSTYSSTGGVLAPSMRASVSRKRRKRGSTWGARMASAASAKAMSVATGTGQPRGSTEPARLT